MNKITYKNSDLNIINPKWLDSLSSLSGENKFFKKLPKLNFKSVENKRNDYWKLIFNKLCNPFYTKTNQKSNSSKKLQLNSTFKINQMKFKQNRKISINNNNIPPKKINSFYDEEINNFNNISSLKLRRKSCVCIDCGGPSKKLEKNSFPFKIQRISKNEKNGPELKIGLNMKNLQIPSRAKAKIKTIGLLSKCGTSRNKIEDNNLISFESISSAISNYSHDFGKIISLYDKKNNNINVGEKKIIEKKKFQFQFNSVINKIPIQKISKSKQFQSLTDREYSNIIKNIDSNKFKRTTILFGRNDDSLKNEKSIKKKSRNFKGEVLNKLIKNIKENI